MPTPPLLAFVRRSAVLLLGALPLTFAPVARGQDAAAPPPATASVSPADAAPRELAIIVNRANKVPPMPEKEVRGIFQVERRFWYGTVPLVLVIRDKGDAHEAFARRVLSLPVGELDALYQRKREVWKDLKVATSDKQAVALVKRDRNAVAYVWADTVAKDKSVHVVATIPLDVTPEEDSVAAGVQRLKPTMDPMRDLWDQLQASLRSPGVPDEDLVKMATAVAEFSQDVHRRAPLARDPPSKLMNNLATKLSEQARKLPELVLKREQAIKYMGQMEKGTCMACHRSFR